MCFEIIESLFNRTTSKTEIGTNDKLCKGEVLMSNNELWKAVFQNDGNFVIYGWKAMWDSDTCGSDGSRMVLQPDGNLVLYNESREPRWSTDTSTEHAHLNCRLKLTDEGNLVLFKENVLEWSSADSRGKK